MFHHALSLDMWDAADRQAGSRQGTYLTTITDGHGRSAARLERIHVGTTIEQRQTIHRFLPTGQIERMILRRQGSPDVERWLRYDSLGRMVLNVEPNTSVGFNPNPATNPNAIKAFRYAYNDAGNMVGYSDARGCGANYVFDTGGRPIAEDRSPCRAHQPAYSAPNLTTGDGTEAFYRYDSPEPAAAAITDAGGNAFTIDASFLRGRLVSVAGLGSMAAMRYDALGRGTGLALRVQKPGVAGTVLAQRTALVRADANADAKDRVVSASTGATLPELLGGDGTSRVIFGYSKRGSLTLVDSSYGRLAGGTTAADNALNYDANGLPKSATLGDAARTRRDYVYNADLRTEDVLTYRANLALWTTPPPGFSLRPAALGRRSHTAVAARGPPLRLRRGRQPHRDRGQPRGAAFDTAAGDYTLSTQTVSVRVLGGPVSARVLYSQQSLPTLTSGQQHVFLELGDHLGSSSFVVDRATGELVEYTTYQAYGAGDYRPGRWGSFREPYQFTGKEQDIEVGLTYFGARYYSPYLGVWISPDPAAIQDLGSDPNPYAYVHGTPLMAVDPDGRIAFLVVVAIAAIIAAAANLGTQLAQNGGSFAQVNWGFKGVLGAFCVGAIAGAVSFGVGSFAVGAFGAAFGAAAAGAVSAGVSYVVGSAFNGFKGFSGGGLLLSMGIGAVGGFIGGALGDVLPQEAWWNSPLSSTASAAASYGINAISEKNFDAANFGIAVASSVGASVASTLAAKAPSTDEGVWLERVENSGDYRLTDSAKNILRPYYEKAGLDLDAMRYRFVNDLPDSTGFCVENRVALDVKDWNDVGANPIKQFKLIAHETAHAIQYMKIGAYHGAGALSFLSRYLFAGLVDPTQVRAYGVPSGLQNTPIEQVNIIDPHYALDQLADTVAIKFAVPAVRKYLGQP